MVCIERNLILRIYTFYIKQSVGARAFVTFLSLYVISPQIEQNYIQMYGKEG